MPGVRLLLNPPATGTGRQSSCLIIAWVENLAGDFNMRRLSVRFFVASLTFVVGVAAASVWLPRRPPVGIKVEVNAPSQIPVKPERTYQAGGGGECMTKDGFPCSFEDVESSDGMSFSKMIVYYGSPKMAGRALRRRLKSAAEVIKREPIYDGAGRQKGEKVIAIFTPDEIGRTAELLWKEGSSLTSLGGNSLQNILEYEKDIKQ
jgi:hypothetical protein